LKNVLIFYYTFSNQLRLDLSTLYALLYPFKIKGEDRPGNYERDIYIEKESLPDWEIFATTKLDMDSIYKKYDNVKIITAIQTNFFKRERIPDGWEVHILDFDGEGRNYDACDFSEDIEKATSVISCEKCTPSKKYEDKVYRELRLVFTRHFYHYGFYFNPTIYDWDLTYNKDKPFCFSYMSGLSGRDGDNNKRSWRQGFIQELNEKFPNSKVETNPKSIDFTTCNRMMLDLQNNGWYWDFNKGYTTLVAETTPIEDVINVFFTEKTFRAMMSGTPIISLLHKDKLKLLSKWGFWICNTELVTEELYESLSSFGIVNEIFNQHETNPIKFKKELQQCQGKTKNNQKILYDWFYNEQEFKNKAIQKIINE